MWWFSRQFAQRFLIVFVCATVFWSFRTSIVAGFDHSISYGAYGRVQWALGAVITQQKGDARGYVSTAAVQQTLIDNGLTEDKDILARFGTTFPQNFSDAHLINNAITAALNAKTDTSVLRIAPGDDIGYVDFMRVAFMLFGDRLSSPFLTYFLIAALGAMAFVIAFRAQPALLVVAGIVTASELLLLRSDLYRLYGNSLLDVRFLSILAVLPAMHILLATLKRPAFSWLDIFLLALQSALIVFVWSARASVIWVVAALAVLVGGAIAYSLARRRLSVNFWPAVLLGAMFAVHSVYVSHTINRLYAEDGGTTHHWLWHSVLLSLTKCSDWTARYVPIYGPAVDDSMPRTVMYAYLKNHPLPQEYYLGTQLTYQGEEAGTRAAFINLALHDPGLIASCFLRDKPALFAAGLERLFSSVWKPSDSLFWILASYVAAIGFYFAASPPRDRQELMMGTGLLTFAFCAASAPNLASDVNPFNLGDAFLLLVSLLAAWSVMLLSEGLRACLNLLSRRSWVPLAEHRE